MDNQSSSSTLELLLRAFFEGTSADDAWVRDERVEEEMQDLSYHRSLDMLVPYQYLLFSLAGDEARAAARRVAQDVRIAADHLLRLIDRYQQEATGEHPEWARFAVLAQAPFRLQPPPGGDTRDPDVVLVMLRDIRFGGHWQNYLDWLDQENTEENQLLWGRILQLAAFEQRYGINLAELMFDEPCRVRHAELAEEYRRASDLDCAPETAGIGEEG